MNQSIREVYLRFADKVEPTSAAWARVCRWVTATPWLCHRLDRLPEDRRQPRLFLAACRYLGLDQEIDDDLMRFDWLVDDWWEQIRELMLSRPSHVDEVGRCAVFVPLLAGLPQPVRLVELGANLGLYLNLDRYHYRSQDRQAAGSRADVGPELVYEQVGQAPEDPGGLVVADRLGVGPRPLRSPTADDAKWLRTLAWPDSRREKLLDGALAVLRDHPVRLLEGQIPEAVVWLEAEVARLRAGSGSVVIMHSGLWSDLPKSARKQVASFIQDSGAHHLSFEPPRAIPGLAAPDPGRPYWVAALDGQARAVACPAGTWVQWL